jgi:hypothetical protein
MEVYAQVKNFCAVRIFSNLQLISDYGNAGSVAQDIDRQCRSHSQAF